MACACAYCALLSLVPLLVVGIAALGYVVGDSERALNQVVAAINSYVPIKAEFLKETLRHVLQDRGLIGLIGLIGLLYAAHQTFLAMQPALNIIWNVSETRHWLRLRFLAGVATLYTLILLGADLAASALFTTLQNLDQSLVPERVTSFAQRMAVGLVPVLLTTLLFALLYRLLPARAASWKAAFLGAFVASALWQLTKLGFGVFLTYIHSYDRIYGSLSGLVILVVWMYYSMAILLLGAEIAADYETIRRGPRAAEARAHSGADLYAATGTSVRQAEAEAARAAEAESAPPSETD